MAPNSSLAERWAKLEPRERSLMTGLIVALAAIVFLAVPLYLHQAVSTARSQNQEIKDFLEKVRDQRDKIDKKRAERDALLGRYAKTMPPLASFVEEAAEAGGLDIEESQGRPDVPHGKKYLERVLLVKFKKVGLAGLVKMFEKIERSNLPVSLTRLNLKPRSGEADSYDVELHVSQFERKGDAKKPEAADKAEPADEDGP